MSLHTQANLLRSMGVPSIWKEKTMPTNDQYPTPLAVLWQGMIREISTWPRGYDPEGDTDPGSVKEYSRFGGDMVAGGAVRVIGVLLDTIRIAIDDNDPTKHIDFIAAKIASKSLFATCGKQVLKDGADFCQAKDDEAAREIADAMNGAK